MHAIAKRRCRRLGRHHHPSKVAAAAAAAALASEEDAATPVFRRVRTVMSTDDGHCILEVFPREKMSADFSPHFFFFFFFFFLEEEEEETMTTMER